MVNKKRNKVYSITKIIKKMKNSKKNNNATLKKNINISLGNKKEISGNLFAKKGNNNKSIKLKSGQKISGKLNLTK